MNPLTVRSLRFGAQADRLHSNDKENVGFLSPLAQRGSKHNVQPLLSGKNTTLDKRNLTATKSALGLKTPLVPKNGQATPKLPATNKPSQPRLAPTIRRNSLTRNQSMWVPKGHEDLANEPEYAPSTVPDDMYDPELEVEVDWALLALPPSPYVYEATRSTSPYLSSVDFQPEYVPDFS
ncbi:hypothetical protein IWQ62_004459, partial [Dispira parvispora]